MKQMCIFLIGVLAFSVSCVAAPKDQAKTKDQATVETPVVLTVTTVSIAEGTGCWARIYDGHDFKGRSLTLVGDQSLPNLEFPNGNDWEGDIDSVAVGPKAKVVLYEDENFADKKSELNASARVADLHKNIASEGVESMKITCL